MKTSTTKRLAIVFVQAVLVLSMLETTEAAPSGGLDSRLYRSYHLPGRSLAIRGYAYNTFQVPPTTTESILDLARNLDQVSKNCKQFFDF